MIRNPLTSRNNDEEIRLEMLIRTSLNDRWASTANSVYTQMTYLKRAKNTRRTYSLHHDHDTTVNQQILDSTADTSNLKEL